MCLITGNKVKTHTSQGFVENKRTKPTKELYFVDNDLFWKKVGRFGIKWVLVKSSGVLVVGGAF
jgi:hypothetical protein